MLHHAILKVATWVREILCGLYKISEQTKWLKKPNPVLDMNKSLLKARETLETRAMVSIGGAMERASWAACRRTGAWMGLLLFGTFRARRAVAARNVQIAFPRMSDSQARRVVRRCYQNFAMTYCEFLHLRTASRESVRAYCEIDRPEIFHAAQSRGRGTVVLIAHLGNWEVMGARLAQDFPLSVVARPTSNIGIEAHIASIRAASKMTVLSKHDSARGALRVLKKNEFLGILPDQHGGPEGVSLPMFGRPTSVVTALARLALMADATVVPCFGVRRTPWLADGRIVARVSPSFRVEKTGDRETDVLNGTRRVIWEIENVVRQNPEQWLWMHKRWRDSDLVAPSNSEIPLSP